MVICDQSYMQQKLLLNSRLKPKLEAFSAELPHGCLYNKFNSNEEILACSTVWSCKKLGRFLLQQ